ncbi:MAG: glycosyltransferase family 4 protein [Actinomycetes bacterium]
MPSLLVTNDFPPKVGGIQSYLHELWRRLPSEDTTVLTTPYAGAVDFDTEQAFRVERVSERVMLPTRSLAGRIDALAREVGAGVILLDPALPLGRLGRRLDAAPHVVIAHGAEITVPGRLPGTRRLLGQVLRGADAVIAAGAYPARECTHAAGRVLQGIVVPPGVDVDRFRPVADEAERAATRSALGLDPDRPLVVGVSRLVPRKGFDVLIEAVAGLDPSVVLAIAGAGRDAERLRRIAERHDLLRPGRVRFLGRIPFDDLVALYRVGDVFAAPCRDRWAGLEAEGFGIVFLEAAASGVPAIAGRSGGSHEAVRDGETGLVVEPRDVTALRERIASLLADDRRRRAMGAAARAWAVAECSYDARVAPLARLVAGDRSDLAPLPS